MPIMFSPTNCCVQPDCGPESYSTPLGDSPTNTNTEWNIREISGTSPTFSVSGSFLELDGGEASLYYDNNLPTGSGPLDGGDEDFRFETEVANREVAGAQAGVFIANGYRLMVDWDSETPFYEPCDEWGEATGASTTITTYVPSTDVALQCIYRKESGGTWEVLFVVGAFVADRLTGQSLPGLSYRAGMVGNDGARWQTLRGGTELCSLLCTEIGDPCAGICPEGVPFEYTLSVSGVSGPGGCSSHCSGLNGSFTLQSDVDGDVCKWLSRELRNGSPKWELVVDGISGNVELIGNNGSFCDIQYEKGISGWNCSSSNILTLNSFVSGCSGPSTLTVVPVP